MLKLPHPSLKEVIAATTSHLRWMGESRSICISLSKKPVVKTLVWAHR